MPYPDYYRYWGKAQPQPNEPMTSPYHLLVYHSLDVAATAHCLLHDEAPIMIDWAHYLKMDKSKLRALLCFLIGLHDLGKFAASFQGLYQANDGFLISVDQQSYPYDKRHDALGWCFYQNGFANDRFCIANKSQKRRIKSALTTLFNSVLGHHGTPIQPEDKPVNFKDLSAVGVKYQNEITPENLQAANKWITDLQALFEVDMPIELLADSDDWQMRIKHISWQLSGLTMLADWLGSDTNYFQYENKVMPLTDYWRIALERAERCINDKGLVNITPPSPFSSIQDSFGFSPSPLQAWAESVPLPDSPQLFVLEDVTGSGKTEAALCLAHRLMAKGAADGFYFGLPTTATSNAMFERIERFMPTLYSPDATHNAPSLVLAHGSKNMNTSFQRLLHNASADCDAKTPQVVGDEISSQCHAWFASSNKRALLASIGVGTIDQALLATLPKKHQPLRLFGLHHKVLIFDEVHSADSYMFELLKSLLQVHLHQGGHAILLTATLSLEKREALARLWLEPYSTHHEVKADQQVTQSKQFPLATQVIAAPDTGMPPVQESAIDSPDRVARTLAVDFMHTTEAVVDYLLQAARGNKCAVWVRNTVADAIDAYDKLLAAGVDSDNIVLFHSRFTLADRNRIESQVLRWFGKQSTPDIRAGKILIATQVFQESLDADSDVMVSDLCPIDYLIQRAGRLHRHQRDNFGQRLDTQSANNAAPRDKPTLMVLAPKFSDNPKANWYSSLFDKSRYVYRHVGQLWLTMRILKQQGCLDLPKDARLLIESVYAKEAQQQIPEALLADSKADDTQQKHKQNTAQDMLIEWDKGYCEKSQTRWFAHDSAASSEANTRFQEIPTSEVVVLKLNEESDSIEFYAAAPKFAGELSTVKIGESMSKKLADIPDQYIPQVTTLSERYHGLEYKKLWLIGSDSRFVYDKHKGLVALNNG